MNNIPESVLMKINHKAGHKYNPFQHIPKIRVVYPNRKECPLKPEVEKYLKHGLFRTCSFNAIPLFSVQGRTLVRIDLRAVNRVLVYPIVLNLCTILTQVLGEVKYFIL